MVYWNFLSFIKVTYWEVQRWGLSSINVRKNYFSKMIENNFNRVLFSFSSNHLWPVKHFPSSPLSLSYKNSSLISLKYENPLIFQLMWHQHTFLSLPLSVYPSFKSQNIYLRYCKHAQTDTLTHTRRYDKLLFQ